MSQRWRIVVGNVFADAIANTEIAHSTGTLTLPQQGTCLTGPPTTLLEGGALFVRDGPGPHDVSRDGGDLR